MVMSGFGLVSWVVLEGYGWLGLVMSDGWLSVVFGGYGVLGLVMSDGWFCAGYEWFLAGYGWFWVVMCWLLGGYGWLWAGYGWFWVYYIKTLPQIRLISHN